MTGLDRYATLAREAAAAVERRQAQYPALVERGKLSADQANAEIRVWRAIAEDWRWVVTLERIDAPPATLDEKVAALEESARRAERAMRRAFARADTGVREAWQQDMAVAAILDRYGDAAAPFVEAWDRYWTMADLRDWYRRDLPDSDRPGIAHYVDAHVRATRLRRAAA
jgi:hypothetical protein